MALSLMSAGLTVGAIADCVFHHPITLTDASRLRQTHPTVTQRELALLRQEGMPDAADVTVCDIDSFGGNSPSAIRREPSMIGYEGSSKTILVVDDRWDNRSVLVNLLEPLGFRMVEAENGQEVLAKAAAHPDLIITDLTMPVMNGIEMLHQIRASASLQYLKVIVSFASVEASDRQISVAAGGNNFLAKPMPIDHLVQAIHRQLNWIWIYQERATPNTDWLDFNQAVIVRSTTHPLPTADGQHLLGLVQRGFIKTVLEVAH